MGKFVLDTTNFLLEHCNIRRHTLLIFSKMKRMELHESTRPLKWLAAMAIIMTLTSAVVVLSRRQRRYYLPSQADRPNLKSLLL